MTASAHHGLARGLRSGIVTGRFFASLRASFFVLLAVVVAGCAQSGPELSAQVAERLDTASNAIADFTDGTTEVVPRDSLLQTVNRARQAGTELRVVVAGAGDEFVSAEAVVNRYGGTAITYQAGATRFEGASRDVNSDQLGRAVAAAKQNFDIGESAAAFVGVIEAEGVQAREQNALVRNVWWLVIPAAAFMCWAAYSYWTARSRRVKRQTEFSNRKQVLLDWAAQLRPELEALRPVVGTSPDEASRAMWQESQEFVTSVEPTLHGARTAGELDVAEMRISRTAIRLRDLRRKFDV